MLRFTKLNPNERLLIESPINRYRIAGPGLVVLPLHQRALARLNVGPQAKSLQFKDVRTLEEVTLDVAVQIIFRIDPELLSPEILPRVATLNDGVWHGVLYWQAEYLLRLLMAQQNWRTVNREEIQRRLERQFSQTLNDRLKFLGIDILFVCLVRTELPMGLQKTMIRAERDGIEAQGRAKVLQSYFEIFGDSLPKAMPYIIQWELMNTVHKNGDPTVLLTAEGLSTRPSPAINGTSSQLPLLHMQLPMQ